ncbi:hypothetical protein [Streptomyces chartreusis]
MLGCFAFVAFDAKMLLIRSERLPGRPPPLASSALSE